MCMCMARLDAVSGGCMLLVSGGCMQGDLEALHTPRNLPWPCSCHSAVGQRKRLDFLMASTCSCIQQSNGDSC
jgi:hypothetical protein